MLFHAEHASGAVRMRMCRSILRGIHGSEAVAYIFSYLVPCCDATEAPKEDTRRFSGALVSNSLPSELQSWTSLPMLYRYLIVGVGYWNGHKIRSMAAVC